VSIDKTYDRDGQVIPDDWYDKTKHPRARFKWGTQQRVGNTKIRDKFTVSTVWLMGVDHGYGDDDPLIFETMVFGEPYDNDLIRYSTEEQAMRGHLATVDALRQGKEPFSWAHK
jgi:hypothetical protein